MGAGGSADIPTPNGQIIQSGPNLFKTTFLLSALLATFYLTQHSVEYLEQNSISSWIKWPFIALIAIWNGVLMLGMGALAHDPGNRS